ncbi:glutaredoxin domain-containing protein [Janibacter limosus]|uniref:glutaredoxin domain-containing protein n=1 Tax=Janibacter limosus TaxID=53458 RepID=UPI000832300E|nr:glutaredoxin domain-containing protein [Janibacter limosus]
MSRWWPALTGVVASVALLVQLVLTGDLSMLVLAVGFLVLAWWLSPLNGRRGPRHADVDARRDDFPVVIYWRPGCVYCLRLRGALGKDRDKATWVSIWADEEAAAFVRSINDGNETVPTVRIGEQVHTNPEPDLVRAALR